MKKYRKFFVILITAALAIDTGLEISDYLEDKSIQTAIGVLTSFALALVMFYEWVKILRKEKEENKG